MRELKNDLGEMLKRSFTMLRDARAKAALYKRQLTDLLRGDCRKYFFVWTENTTARHRPSPTSTITAFPSADWTLGIVPQ